MHNIDDCVSNDVILDNSLFSKTSGEPSSSFNGNGTSTFNEQTYDTQVSALN